MQQFDVLGIGRTKLQTAHVSSRLPTHARIGLLGISRNRKRAEESLVLNCLDSPQPRNTVRVNRLTLQGPAAVIGNLPRMSRSEWGDLKGYVDRRQRGYSHSRVSQDRRVR